MATFVHPVRHLLRAKDLIDARYRDPLDVPTLARAARLSPAHFSREFRREFGETPHQYLLTRRLERAAALLRNTDRSVSEICFDVGLRSVGSFTTSFGRAYGVTPTAYRAAHPPAAQRVRVPTCVLQAWARPQYRPTARGAPQDEGETMALQIGETAPDFAAETTEGAIRFHDWIGDSWAVLFSHPKDFTPVCTTELGYMAKIKPEFDRRGVKVIGLSVDPVGNHEQWAADIAETQGHAPNYPIIGDADFNVSKLYGMLPASTEGDPLARTPADNQTVRNVFVIGPDKKVKLVLVYPMTTGRNFDEVLRVIDSLQLTAKHRVATPANWTDGGDVIIAGSVSNDEAKEIYPDGWEEPRPYIRIVPQPR